MTAPDSPAPLTPVETIRKALLGYRERGAVVFEYGNGIRAQAAAHGVVAAGSIPGFVAVYVRPIFARGIGPFRWICLTGDPDDLHAGRALLGRATAEMPADHPARADVELALKAAG